MTLNEEQLGIIEHYIDTGELEAFEELYKSLGVTEFYLLAKYKWQMKAIETIFNSLQY